MSVPKLRHLVAYVFLPRMRLMAACWPALAFYMGAWPSAASGSWVAAWLFCLSGTVLAVTLYRQAARTRIYRIGITAEGATYGSADQARRAPRSTAPDQNGAEP